MLEWNFDGGEDGSRLAARRGTQRVYFGDTVIDEVMSTPIKYEYEKNRQ